MARGTAYKHKPIIWSEAYKQNHLQVHRIILCYVSNMNPLVQDQWKNKMLPLITSLVYSWTNLMTEWYGHENVLKIGGSFSYFQMMNNGCGIQATIAMKKTLTSTVYVF